MNASEPVRRKPVGPRLTKCRFMGYSAAQWGVALVLVGGLPSLLAACAPRATLAPSGPPAVPVSAMIEHPGWQLASACFLCHGMDGKDETFGALNVYSAEDFIDRMNELKASEAADEGLMKPHSAGYTDEQIRLLADYFSKVE